MSVATGHECVVVDFGARKKKPRAIYQGLLFIEHALWKRWFDVEIISICKNCNVTTYFRKVYSELSSQAKSKLDYFKPYILANGVNIAYITDATEHDGDKKYYREILSKERMLLN